MEIGPFLLLLLVVCIASGFVGSLAGLGGGVVVMPILILLGFDLVDAVGVSRITIIATSTTS